MHMQIGYIFYVLGAECEYLNSIASLALNNKPCKSLHTIYRRNCVVYIQVSKLLTVDCLNG